LACVTITPRGAEVDPDVLQERDVVRAHNVLDHWCRRREVHFVDIEPFGRQESGTRTDNGPLLRSRLSPRTSLTPASATIPRPGGDPVASCTRGRIGGTAIARAERTEERGNEVDRENRARERRPDAVADRRGEQPASTIEREPRDSIDLLLSGFQEREGAIGALFYRTQREQIGQGRNGGRYGAHESS
jgi:hypothetical protein